MRTVDHRGHAVKTETVEVIFVEPELAVTQQKMQHFVLAVVEAETVPCRVLTPRTIVEILIPRAVEVTQTFQLVLHCVRVYEVHDYLHPATVYIVDQRLQLIRRTETAGGCEEIRYVVTKTPVVRVLLHRHNLYAVIAEFGDTRQHVAAELLIRVHFLLLGRHTDVALVDEQSFVAALSPPLWGGRVGFSVLPFVFGLVPYLRREDLRLLVLHHAAHVTRYAFAVTALPFDEELVQLLMLDGVLRHLGFPDAVTDGLQTVGFVFLPSVHIALDIDRRGVRCPLAQDPLFVVAVMV